MLSASVPPRLDCCDRQALIDYFDNAWQLEEALMQSITAENTFYLRPDPLRNCLIFYLGHTTAFYINKLRLAGLLTEPINADYEKLFAVGVDPASPEELQQQVAHIQWPTVRAVHDYRAKVYQVIRELLESSLWPLPIHSQHPFWALLMGIEHSRVHLETSSMLLRQLPPEKLQCPAGWAYAPSHGAVPANPMLEVPGGVVTLGKTEPTFGWDMEYGNCTRSVAPFLASQYLVSNGEFLEFLEADGYRRQEYWGQEAWDWLQRHQVSHPKFWLPASTGYRYRATFEEIALPLDWPVEVNHYEAIAFCRWKGPGYRLLGEAEWQQALRHSTQDQHNLNLQFASPSPVNLSATNGLADLRGNVWEWLQDTFAPLPGFQPHPLYADHAAPFFDQAHYLMLGGSWISNGSMAASSYRNWFRPYFYQHAGFRLCQSFL